LLVRLAGVEPATLGLEVLRPLAGDARVFRYFARRKLFAVDASECDRLRAGASAW